MNGRKAKELRRAGVPAGPGIRRKNHEHPGDCVAVLRTWVDSEPMDVRCDLIGPHDEHCTGEQVWR